MRVGIVGAGAIGRAIAKHLGAAGVETLISTSRAAEALTAVARELGPTVKPVPRIEAARAEVVIVAVRWEHHEAALSDLPGWQGRILIDAMNPIVPPGFTVAPLKNQTSSELIAQRAQGARIVKAFNTLPPIILGASPQVAGGRRAVVLSGDDADAKQVVGRLIERLGFAAIDLGTLVAGGRLQQFPGGVFAGLNLIRVG